MKNRTRFILSLYAFGGALTAAYAGLAPASAVAASQCAPAGGDPETSAALAALLSDSREADLKRAPLEALLSGDKRYADQFGEPLRNETLAAEFSDRKAEYARLQTIDRNRLGPIERIAYDVFARQLRHNLEAHEKGLRRIQALSPLDAFYGAQASFGDIASGRGGVAFESVKDYEDGLARLEGFARHMRRVVDRLREGLDQGHAQPRVNVETILRQVDEMLALETEETPFYQPVVDMPAGIAEAESARIAEAYRQAIETEVRPAYRLWRDYLGNEYLPAARAEPGLGGMKGGRALYDWLIAGHTTTTLSAEEIHAIGLAEVARIETQMKAVMAKAGYDGTLQEFFVHLRTDPAFVFDEPEGFFNAFKDVEAHVRTRMSDLFHDMQKAPFDSRPLPALGSTRGSGYYRPGPPDASAPGVLYVNVTDMRSRPIWQTESLFLHEAIPGHHYQLSLAQENETLPEFLRFGRYTAYIEGWGLYAESLGAELGLYTDPYQLFGHLDWEMLRAVRLVVDTGMHAKGWSRRDAIDFFLAHSAFTEKDATSEVDRYISMPGQALAYKIGQMKIEELKNQSREAQGEAFDIRDFHDEVLNAGALPLSTLETKINDWTARVLECGGQ